MSPITSPPDSFQNVGYFLSTDLLARKNLISSISYYEAGKLLFEKQLSQPVADIYFE
jgi:hypothetical protein